MNTKNPSTKEVCSFCNKPADEAKRLLAAADGVRICNECVTLCREIISEEFADMAASSNDISDMYPKRIKSFLDQHIIGQNYAKRVLSVAVYNHYKRIRQDEFTSKGDSKHPDADVELSKGNILLIGPTGSGKTLMAKTLAKKLDVPFTIADATSLTEAGYVGEDVENIIKNLWIAAGRDAERASKGIVCIDEIDKLANKAGAANGSRDVGGEGVQQALLKMVESSQIMISPSGGRNRPNQDFIRIDTTNILFICCGSFPSLAENISRRLGQSRVGFGSNVTEKNSIDSKILRHVRPSDLNKFGLIPEFIGRFPIMVTFDQLDEEEMVEILWKPKNSLIAQYQKLLQIEGVKLHFEHDALVAIVKLAATRGTGARGLRSIIEEVMLDIMYDIPSLNGVRECIITGGCVTNGEQPKLVFDKKTA